MIIAIDPGSLESGYVIVGHDLTIHEFGVMENELLRKKLSLAVDYKNLVIEMMSSYGMAIGKTSMDTLVWIGRFMQTFPNDVTLITRAKIKQHLCKFPTAKDKNIAIAVKDRFPPTGGGSDPHKGIKSKPGPLYGLSSHMFSALAVAIAYIEGCEHYRFDYE